MSEIMTILDLPNNELEDLKVNIPKEEPQHLLEDKKVFERIEYIADVPREEKVMKESLSSFNSALAGSSAHISHGVLNININRMLHFPQTVNKLFQSISKSDKNFNEESLINKFGLSIYNGENLLETMKTEEDEKPVIEETKTFICSICTKPALKYSSYGGSACSSCRSFFRRSSQNNLHTLFHCKRKTKCAMDPNSRRKCQYCRFQTCLRSGMRITWVLSDEERKRRFGKDKKVEVDSSEQRLVDFRTSSPIQSSLYLSFTTEEQQVLTEATAKYKIPWLQKFLIFNKESATNLIKFTYRMTNLKEDTWENLRNSMHTNFTQSILPQFKDVSGLSSSDFGQIINSPSSGIELFFRGCFALQMKKSVIIRPGNCPMASQVNLKPAQKFQLSISGQFYSKEYRPGD